MHPPTYTTTDDTDYMPRITDVTPDGLIVVESCVRHDDGTVQRGGLWTVISGDFRLIPTRPGLINRSRWVPGYANPLDGSYPIAISRTSSKQALHNARNALARQRKRS